VEANAGGSFVGHGAEGTVRIVVDEDRRVIVGATFTGVDVAESLHAATIAVIAEVPLERSVARRALLSNPQRGLAAAAGKLRPLARGEISSVPLSLWSLALPAGSTTCPSTTIGLFQCPGSPGSLAIGRGEEGR